MKSLILVILITLSTSIKADNFIGGAIVGAMMASGHQEIVERNNDKFSLIVKQINTGLFNAQRHREVNYRINVKGFDEVALLTYFSHSLPKTITVSLESNYLYFNLMNYYIENDRRKTLESSRIWNLYWICLAISLLSILIHFGIYGRHYPFDTRGYPAGIVAAFIPVINALVAMGGVAFGFGFLKEPFNISCSLEFLNYSEAQRKDAVRRLY